MEKKFDRPESVSGSFDPVQRVVGVPKLVFQEQLVFAWAGLVGLGLMGSMGLGALLLPVPWSLVRAVGAGMILKWVPCQ